MDAGREAGAAESPFIDPAGYRKFIDDSEARFNQLVAEETKAAR